MQPNDATFCAWADALVARHQRDLRFAEVRRGLQALSAQYVQRRLEAGNPPLAGRAKRAAFAAYYAPMHYAVVAGICAELQLAPPEAVHDWGCGTGVGAAAWARAAGEPATAQLTGLDASRWALGEAAWNWRTLGLSGRTVAADLARVRPPPAPGKPGAVGIVLAFAVNELPPAVRDHVLQVLQAAAQDGCALLVVEPIAKGLTPWWGAWHESLAPFGARIYEHRIPSPLPQALVAYARAAKLDHRVLTARSLVVDPKATTIL